MMNRSSVRIAVLIAAAACATPVDLAQAQGGASDDLVSWSPRRPRQGTLFRLLVDGVTDPRAVTGSVAGEPLHFASDGPDRAFALAPVPIDSARSVTATIIVADALGTDTIRARTPVAPGGYPSEKLTVAPRFSTKPDTALQRRIAEE